MINLYSILKKQGHNFVKNVHLVKDIVFPVVMYRYKGWVIKKAGH